MRLQSCSLAWFAMAICMTAGLPFATADDAPGVVRMNDYPTSQIQRTSFLKGNCHAGDSCGEECCPSDGCAAPAECCPGQAQCCPNPVTCGSDAACCNSSGGCCSDGCNGGCHDGCNGSGRGNRYGSSAGGCGCGCCGRENCSLLGKWFGGPKSRCSCDSCDYCGKGKSGTLFDCLFGCMTPSGMCCQGAPLCGHYQITYADQPSYADPRDGQAWGAQGYGMPITVPTAPVVRYSYNYSHGTPASRLTPLSTYNPATSPQALYKRSWH